MMKAAVALLLIGLALQVGGAEASTSSTAENAKEAAATFSTQTNGLRTSVEITLAETEVASPGGVDRGLHADIEILQHDTRGGHNHMIDVAGSVDTHPNALDLIAEDLSSASLSITIPVCGARPNHNGRLKQRPFNECFDVEVALEWTATGETYSSSGTDDYPLGDCSAHVLSSYQRTGALSSGTIIVGGANFAASPSTSAALSASNYTTTVTCPE
ncbi:MAG TPA: hypothetical protein VGR43_09880 [Dehalococcoidia bacterium]|jgi:hypothetical protein|nr:hypothetical protein [Dehalococcoidia bacterium]